MRIYIVPRGGSGGEAGALPPAPTDPSVSLTIAGGEVVAVRRFEGNATQVGLGGNPVHEASAPMLG